MRTSEVEEFFSPLEAMATNCYNVTLLTGQEGLDRSQVAQ
jgi:hypothetical protein